MSFVSPPHLGLSDNRFSGLLREIEESAKDCTDLSTLRKVAARLHLLSQAIRGHLYDLENTNDPH